MIEMYYPSTIIMYVAKCMLAEVQWGLHPTEKWILWFVSFQFNISPVDNLNLSHLFEWLSCKCSVLLVK